MLIKVTKDTVKIVDENYVLNKGEYHVNTCYFEFSEEYTDDLVKKAIFVNDSIKKEMLIANNQCNIPYEVLVNDSFELRVYAYEIDENEELILRYSPTHTIAYLREGSYVSGATAGEEITPTQFEQYQQALQEGLAEVNEKLDDVDTAITEANNLDAEVTKTLRVSTLSLTKKDGSVQSVNIFDGEDGNTGPSGKDGKNGKDGVDGITPTIGDNGNWYLGDTDTGKPSRGIQGETGPAGADGRDGQDGSDGTDGYSPSASVSKSGDTATITITDKNGTTTTTISDGTNGINGTNGTDGYSPTATVTKSGTTATISITDKNGTTTATVSDGTNGQDGQNGVGVPTGGTQGQILAKATATDYDTEWIDAPSGGGDKKIYDFDLPSYTYWSSNGTTTVNSNNFTTTQAEQLQAILEAGITNIFIRLKFESNYPFSVFTYLNSGGIDGNRQAWTFQGLFKDNLNNTYGAKFDINITNNAVTSFAITFDKNEGYIRTTRIKTANNTSAGNVYDVTYINSVVGDIETLLGGI